MGRHVSFFRLAELFQRAGKYMIALDPMPYSGVPDLKTARDVAQKSWANNAYMILDTWHWVRGDQPYDLLTEEMAKKVISIQINDAYECPYAKCILRDESMHDSLL